MTLIVMLWWVFYTERSSGDSLADHIFYYLVVKALNCTAVDFSMLSEAQFMIESIY